MAASTAVFIILLHLQVTYSPSRPPCTYKLGEIKCNTGYEPVLEGDKQVCRVKHAAMSTACQSAKISVADRKISKNNRSVLSGERVRVAVDPEYTTCEVQVVPLIEVKTAKSNEGLTLTIPVRHQVGLVNCANSQDCTLPAIDVVCPEGQRKVHGVCQEEERRCDPAKNEVRTESGGCAQLQIDATVQSDSLAVKLIKPNFHLKDVFVTPSKTVAVSWGKYALNYSYHLANYSYHLAGVGHTNWIQVGDQSRGVEDRRYFELALHFNATSMLDGTRVDASLDFIGQGLTKTAELARDTISISGIVDATPSFKHSTMKLDNPDPTEGQQVRKDESSSRFAKIDEFKCRSLFRSLQ